MQKLLIILAVSLSIFISILFVVKRPKITNEVPVGSSPVLQKSGTFSSTLLKFSIEVPMKYQIIDSDVFVDLMDDDTKISIVKNGTNFGDLKSYIDEFDTRRGIVSEDEKWLTIDGNEAMSRVVRYPKEGIVQKSYYIYVSNRVYILSTEDMQLYNDLDQIAQSFRYTP